MLPPRTARMDRWEEGRDDDDIEQGRGAEVRHHPTASMGRAANANAIVAAMVRSMG